MSSRLFFSWAVALTVCAGTGGLMPSISRAAGSASSLRIDINAGQSTQQFSGISGADFTMITRMQYGGGIFYRFTPWLDTGFQFAMTTPIEFTPFQFKNNLVGSYTTSISQYQFVIGIVQQKIRFHLITGLERMPWSGSPALGQASYHPFHVGGQLSYDLLSKGKFRLPVVARVIHHGTRTIAFTNFPDDTVTVKAGLEFNILGSLSFEF